MHIQIYKHICIYKHKYKYIYIYIYYINVKLYIYTHNIRLGFEFLDHFWARNQYLPFKSCWSLLIFLPSESDDFMQRQVLLKMPKLGTHPPKPDSQLQSVAKRSRMFSLDKNQLDVFRKPVRYKKHQAPSIFKNLRKTLQSNLAKWPHRLPSYMAREAVPAPSKSGAWSCRSFFFQFWLIHPPGDVLKTHKESSKRLNCLAGVLFK